MPDAELNSWTLHSFLDLVVSCSYIILPLALFFYAQRRADLGLKPVYFFFALFSAGWGSLHLLEAWQIWVGHQWVQTSFQVLTAVAALYTLYLLIALFPSALQAPNPVQLLKQIDQLNREKQQLLTLQQSLQEKIAAHNATIEEQLKELNDRQDRIDSATAQNQNLTEQLQRSQEEHRLLTEDFASRGRELETRTNDNLTLQTELRLCQTKLAQTENDLVQVRSEKDNLEKNLWLLEEVVRHSPESIIRVSRDGKVESLNHSAEEQSGYTLSDALGIPILDFVPTDHRTEAEEIFEKVQLGERIDAPETLRVNRAGAALTVSERLVPLRSRAGDLVGVVCYRRDLASLKQLEKELQESKEREQDLRNEIETLVTALPAPIWISHDRSGKEIIANGAARQILDLEERDVFGDLDSKNPVWYVYPGNGEAAELHPVQQACRMGATLLRQEVEIRRPSGPSRFIRGSAVPLVDSRGGIRGCLGAFIDVSSLKQTERENSELKEKLQHSEQTLKQLTSELDSIRRNLKAHEDFAGAMKHAMLCWLKLPPDHTLAGTVPA